MNKAELESKHLSELHALAAEAGVPRYRMLRREELVEKLSGGEQPKQPKRATGDREETRERPQRRQRQRPQRERAERKPSPRSEQRPARDQQRPAREEQRPARAEQRPARDQQRPAREEQRAEPAEASSPGRRRRRRRFGRRAKGLSPRDLLLPPPARQALVYGESPDACTRLLREIAAELADASKGPDPIALLVDPSPEELADWRREAPDAEIVAAGKARHATDALAQASRRAEGGEDVILLVDSLTKLDDADVAREIFDGGLSLGSAKGSLTVVAALQRQA
jgi:hypothetical protein